VGGFCSIGILASGTGKRLLGWRFSVCDGAWEAADFLYQSRHETTYEKQTSASVSACPNNAPGTPGEADECDVVDRRPAIRGPAEAGCRGLGYLHGSHGPCESERSFRLFLMFGEPEILILTRITLPNVRIAGTIR
jgi:hypothetical protein